MISNISSKVFPYKFCLSFPKLTFRLEKNVINISSPTVTDSSLPLGKKKPLGEENDLNTLLESLLCEL